MLEKFQLSEQYISQFGTRREFCIEKTSVSNRGPSMALIQNKYLCQIFETNNKIEKEESKGDIINLKEFGISKYNIEKVEYSKLLRSDWGGLHRRLNYKLNLEIDTTLFDVEKFEDSKCSVSILDFVERDFYIDYEEVCQDKRFIYYESERMDIEKMNSISQQNYYMLKVPLTKQNVSYDQNLAKIKIDFNINYHLRYGEANESGKAKYWLGQSFDIATDCFTILPKQMAEDFKKKLQKCPRLNWAIQILYQNEYFQYFVLDKHFKKQETSIPVGNKKFGWIVKLSTGLFILYSFLIINLGIFSNAIFLKRKK